MDAEKKPKRYKVGIALSGGGTRGFAHIGVLKALNERGIQPEVISGVSAGAIIGAFYADGYLPTDIYNIFRDKTLFRLMTLSLKKVGLMRMKGLVQVLTTFLHSKNLEDLKLPLYVTTTNFNSGKGQVFSQGNLIRVLRASAAIPIIFHPVSIDGEWYVDGGITSNLPVKPIEAHCDIIIGSNVNPIGPAHQFDNVFSIIDRSVQISIANNVSDQVRHCQLYIEPPEIKQYPLLRFGDEHKKYQIGYEWTHKVLDDMNF